jgi:predicted DNA-binding transcriptional regulator YafY
MRTLPAPVTAARLAEETGVSQRSLYRDIDSLRAAGARIDGERGYGYRLTEDYALPPQTFSRDEIEAIVLGMAQVKHMGDPALARAAEAVLAKVAATLPDDRESIGPMRRRRWRLTSTSSATPVGTNRRWRSPIPTRPAASARARSGRSPSSIPSAH